MSGTLNLNGLLVLLSGSLPDALKGTARADDLSDLLVTLVGGILSANGRIVFGGHPSFTPVIHRVAQRAAVGPAAVELFQPEALRSEAPAEVHDAQVFDLVRWASAPASAHSAQDLADLDEMRRQMIERAQAAVFAGGRTTGFRGAIPGIRDEYDRFRTRWPDRPAFLIGLLDGEAAQIIADLEAGGAREPNPLDDAELAELHHTDDVDLAVSLVLAGLRRDVATP